MSDAITVLSDTIFVSLVNTTWQITLLVPLVALLIWVFRIKSAATRYSLWLFVLFAIIALPLITPFIPQIDMTQFRSQRTAGDRPDDLVRLGMGGGEAGELAEDGDPVPSVGAAKVYANRGGDVSLINPVSIAYFIWCAGALFAFCITLGAHINLRRLRVNSPDVKDPAALEMLSRLRQRVKVRRPVALKVSSKIYTPMSLGIFSPTIILPDGGFGGIPELEMILTHELAHIRRWDYLVNILQNVLKAIFFFHPLYHLMNRSLAKEREHICDDWVIHVTEQRSGYAECIIGLLERALHKPVNVPVTLSMAERKRDIPGRIDMIVNKKRRIATKVSGKALFAVLLIGCLSLPIISSIELVGLAGAKTASHEQSTALAMAQSPQKAQIVFESDRDGDLEIYVMDADGKNQRRLTRNPSWATEAAWSPDGQSIAFAAYWDGNREIYVMDADGKNERRLTYDDAEDWFPAWSTDSQRIAFASNRDGNWEIYVMDADGENQRRLTDNPAADRCPAWSPDGQRIAYNEGEWGSAEIYVMDADGRNPRRLTNSPGGDFDPVWSPDGQSIAFVSGRAGRAEVYVMDADGGNPRNLTNNPATDGEPHWFDPAAIAVSPAGKLKTTWGEIKALIRPH